jgi:hypothetical protein
MEVRAELDALLASWKAVRDQTEKKFFHFKADPCARAGTNLAVPLFPCFHSSLCFSSLGLAALDEKQGRPWKGEKKQREMNYVV